MKTTIIAGAVIIAGAAVALSGGGDMAIAGGFDQQKWKAEKGNTSHKNPRIGMVSDAEKVLRLGMKRDEVKQILGEPDRAQTNTLEYDIGASPYGIDYESFVLEFDELGLLKTWRIVRG